MNPCSPDEIQECLHNLGIPRIVEDNEASNEVPREPYVFETTIAKKGIVDWEKECSNDLVHWGALNSRYMEDNAVFPKTLLWDGIKNKPESIIKNDYFCTVMTYNRKGSMEMVPMGVYQVESVLGPTHRFGREWWDDRGSSTVRLMLRGLIRRGTFCSIPGGEPRKLKSPMGTQRCKNISIDKLIGSVFPYPFN